MIRILIVEDEAFVALDLKQTLSALGYEVVGTAAKGKEAINQINTLVPDLILMDIMLADDIDGIEVAQQIRTHFQMPIVFLTAYSDPTTINRMKRVEPFGYIRKPYDEEILRVSIELALHKFEAEKALILSERRLQTTLRSIGDGVITTDAGGKVQFINEIAQTLTGWSQEEAVGEPFTTVFHILNEESRQPAFNPINRVLSEGIILGLANHTVVISKDGRETPIDDSAAPIIDDNGVVMGMVIVFRDITMRRESELMLRQTQRLDSLGLLAGGIAHDFNNLLTSLMGQASLLQTRLQPQSWESRRVEKIFVSAERAKELANHLLSYAGKQELSKQNVDLNRYLREHEEFMRVLQSPQLSISLELGEQPLSVSLDPTQFSQVLLNLIINAREAIEHGEGKLVIRTSTIELMPEEAEKYLSAERSLSGRFALLEVSDNGKGMERATRERIFDPFFTTKPEGTGLGLATLIGIIYGHNGAIAVNSEVGLGSTFSILLPLSNAAVLIDEEKPMMPQTETSFPTGTLLVVDDREIILEAVTDILEDKPVTVLTATGGKEGIERFQAHQAEINVVLLDVQMPDMSGITVLNELEQMRPDIKVILSSGYSPGDELSAAIEKPNVYFLAKPYTYHTFIDLIQSLLGPSDQTDR